MAGFCFQGPKDTVPMNLTRVAAAFEFDGGMELFRHCRAAVELFRIPASGVWAVVLIHRGADFWVASRCRTTVPSFSWPVGSPSCRFLTIRVTTRILPSFQSRESCDPPPSNRLTSL